MLVNNEKLSLEQLNLIEKTLLKLEEENPAQETLCKHKLANGQSSYRFIEGFSEKCSLCNKIICIY